MNAIVRESQFEEGGHNIELGDLSSNRLKQDALLFEQFGESLAVAHHDYHSLDLFSDDALIELLTHFPRRRLQCFTMGQDLAKPEEWQAVCVRGVNGADLFEAVKNGRLWINVTNIDHHDDRYRRLVTDMYAQVESLCPTVENPGLYYNTLVLASPDTQFYYHANPENNMLWNMRGELTLKSLPALDFRFLSQQLLEEIFANEASGTIPYSHEFAQFAESVSVGADQCAWWPQTAPIHMQYHSFCVSLVTSYFCPMRQRRANVQLANRYLLRSLGIGNRSIAEHGVSSELKQLVFRTIRRCFATRKSYDFTDSYLTNLKVNLSEPQALEELDHVLIPEFSKYSEMLYS
ncbi:MAG: hypothetical protein AB8B86_06795 [Pseudomonadales bacterium]